MEGWTTPAGTDPARDAYSQRYSRVRHDACAEIHLMLLNGIMEEDLIGQLALSRRIADTAFIRPMRLTIMMILPLALIGAIAGLFLNHNTMSMGAMIGIILLMGLVTNNAILLVDRAIERVRDRSETPIAAVLESWPETPATDSDDERGGDPRHAADRALARRRQ